MAFWMAIPVLIGAKVLYDYVTDDDSPSSSSSGTSYDSDTNLKSAKKERESEREKAVKSLIKAHRVRHGKELERAAEQEGAIIESSTATSYMVKHQEVGGQIQELTKARRLFTDTKLKLPRVAKTKVSLHSEDSLMQEALRNADGDYGELAGIDHQKNYDPKSDPYLIHLEKNRLSILGSGQTFGDLFQESLDELESKLREGS